PNGQSYLWWDGATGQRLFCVPRRDALPELPTAWVEYLNDRGAATETSVTEPYGGPSYAEMDAAQRAAVDAYLAPILPHEKAALAAAASWPEGHRDEHDRGWQKRVADLAWELGS